MTHNGKAWFGFSLSVAAFGVLLATFVRLPGCGQGAPDGRKSGDSGPTDLAGRILDSATHQPVGGATVIVRGSALQATSGPDGRFHIINADRANDANFQVVLPRGSLALEFRAPGFQERQVPVSPTDRSVDIQLVAGGAPNPVRVAPSGRYFQFENGSPFQVTGFHNQIVQPPFCYDWNPTRGPKDWQYQPGKGEEFARSLRQKGVTVIRIYLEEAYILEWNNRVGLFQDPIGIYNPEVINFWDQMFDWADRYGLKILVGMYHTDQMVRNWSKHPYSSSCGGPGPRDKADGTWYTSSQIRECQKRDLRYVIDRWGQRDSLFAIDLMPEANLHWGGTPQQIIAWCQDMTGYARQYALQRWGHVPLLTMSAGDMPSQWDSGLFIDNPNLDFVATHIYDGKVGNPVLRGVRPEEDRVDCVAPALEVNRRVRQVLASMKVPKPYLTTETGPIFCDPPLDKHCVVSGKPSPWADEEYFHNVMWADFASGGAGSPIRWAFRPNTPQGYRLTDNMLADLGILKRFQQEFLLCRFSPVNIDAKLRWSAGSNPGIAAASVHAMGCADAWQGVVWMLQDRAPMPSPEPSVIEGASLVIQDRPAGIYEAQFWDTRKGIAYEAVHGSPDPRGVLILPLPSFRRDLAVLFRRRPVESSGAEWQSQSKPPSDNKEFLEWSNRLVDLHRRRDVLLDLRDAQGRSLGDAFVRVDLVRHAFHFGGAAIAAQCSDKSTDREEWRKRFTSLFNYAVVDFFWGWQEKTRGKPNYDGSLQTARWCKRQGMEVLGHHFLWHYLQPEWLPTDLREAEPLFERHVQELAAIGSGSVDHWVAINESAISHLPGFQGSAEGRWVKDVGAATAAEKVLSWARQSDLSPRYVLNDWDRGGLLHKQLTQLKARRSLPDAIGIETHMHKQEVPIAEIWDTCQKFTAFGRPLQFTEVTVLSGPHGDITKPLRPWPSTPEGEDRQAMYVEKLYRTLFAHPGVEAIVWWDLADKWSWENAPAGLLRQDLSPKPSFRVLEKLICQEWWTRTQGTSTSGGEFRFRGTYGRYRVEVRTRQQTHLQGEFDVSPFGPDRVMTICSVRR